MTGTSDVLTLSETAAYLRVNVKTVRRMMERGELPGVVRIGGQWRVSRIVLERHMHGKAMAS